MPDPLHPSDSSGPDILYVITDLELGGVPLHLHRLVKAMRDRALRATVVSLAGPGPVGERMRADGIAALACNGRGGWDWRVLRRLGRIIAETRPRIIHSLLFHANLAARWAAQATDFPAKRLICEIQTVEVERPWHLWVDRLTYDLCRLTVGNSPSVIQHLEHQARIPPDRLRLIRGGIDPLAVRNAEPASRAALGVPDHAALILWTGRLDPVKGLPLLLDAFSHLPAALGAHLCLAGGGPMREELESQTAHLNLQSRVHFLGPRSDVPSLLRAADLFVFPSRTEGLPNALLEAMAAGCPIVTTDVPGCRDLITHGETGLCVPYGDTQALADAMRTLLTDRTLAGRLAERSRTAAECRWNIRDTFAAYASLYAELA